MQQAGDGFYFGIVQIFGDCKVIVFFICQGVWYEGDLSGRYIYKVDYWVVVFIFYINCLVVVGGERFLVECNGVVVVVDYFVVFCVEVEVKR